MKFIIPLLVVATFFSCNLTSKLNGMYISTQRDTIIIDKTGTLVGNNYGRENQLIVKQRGNILKFKTTWYSNRLLNRTHKLYFKIIKAEQQKIILMPITKWSKQLFNERDSLFLQQDTTYKMIKHD